SPPRTPGGRRPDRDPSGAGPPRRARRATALSRQPAPEFAMVSSRVMTTEDFFESYQREKAVDVSSSSWRPSGVRVSSERTLNKYVPSPATVTGSEVLPIGVAKMA